MADLEAARDATAAATGLKLFSRLRGESHAYGTGWTFFEWNFGPVNAAISPEVIASAWSHFLRALEEIEASK